MHKDESRLAAIRRRWRAWDLISEWQKLPRGLRDGVIGCLEEEYYALGAHQTEAGRARSIAADALEAMQSPLLMAGMEGIAADIRDLLAEIDRLSKGGPRRSSP